MSKVTLLRYLLLIVFRAVYLVLWYERKHAVISFQIKMFLVGKVPRSHPFSLTVAPIDGQNSNRGLVPAARCSSYAFVIYNGRKESDGDSENHHVHSDDVDIDYDGDIDDEDSLDDDDSDGDDDNEGDTLEDVFIADDSAIRNSSPIDSTSLVGSTAREAVEAIVQQVLAQRTLAAERIKWVQDRLEVTATCLRPEHGPDEPLDLSTPPSRPSIEDLNAAHRAIYALLETQGPLENFLESCEILVSSPGVADELVYDRDFVSFKGFPVRVTMSEPFKKQLQVDGTLHSRDAEHVTLTLKGRMLRLPRSQVLRVALPPPKYEANDEQIRKLR